MSCRWPADGLEGRQVAFSVLDQLELGSRLVIPVGSPYQQLLKVFLATPEGPADFAVVPCRFVPLVADG